MAKSRSPAKKSPPVVPTAPAAESKPGGVFSPKKNVPMTREEMTSEVTKCVLSCEYRDIPGHPGYRAGSDGTILTCWEGRGKARRLADKWRLMEPMLNRQYGGLRVSVWKGGKHRVEWVHRLVLFAFVGPCPEGMECCHFPDRDRSNNRVDNLRWDTSKNNHGDRIIHGTSGKGEKNVKVKLTEEVVHEIRGRVDSGESPYRIYKEYDVSFATVYRIKHRKNWAHI